MQKFYKKALFALIFLVLANALLACFCGYQSYLSLSLLPADSGAARWIYRTYTDVATGGSSTVHLHDQTKERLRYDFRLTRQAPFPYVSSELGLVDDKGKPALVDWSKYSTITFVAKCSPVNSMQFVVTTFDKAISTPGNFDTYRSPGTYFPCNEQGMPVSLDLARLSSPEWWFSAMDLSQQGYSLDHVTKIVFGTSLNSPLEVNSYLEISELTLHGRDYRYLAALALLVVASCVAFGIWFFRAHTRALTASLDLRMKKDLPLMAYRQLTLEPYKDKEKASVLRFIATNYTDPQLDLERVVNETGTNRNKVNEVLKTELDMTFTSYLNKLRLTEAARLLIEKNNAAVAEIAYSVGYANVSYFNKLFKEEYGCTPKSFRSIATQHPSSNAAPSPPQADSPV